MRLMLLPFGLLLSTMLWAPGLASWMPFGSVIIAIELALLALASFAGAKGTFKVREHVSDMAPWAATVLILTLIAR